MEILSIIAIILSAIAISKANSAQNKAQILADKLDVAAIALGLKPDTDKSTSQSQSYINTLETKTENVSDSTQNQNSAVGDHYNNNDYVDDTPSPFVTWLKDNWIMKLGVFLILIGFVWALYFAYQNQYLTNSGVSTLGLLFGVSIMVFGFIRMKSFVGQGSIFMLLGTGLVMLTTYFMKIKMVITEPIVLMIIMLAALAITAAVSVIYSRKSLSVCTLVLALLVPAILSTGNNNYLGLYIYLLIVVLSTIWVVALRGWRILTLLSLIGVCMYSAAGVISGFGIYENAALVFAFVFAIVFFITNTISIVQISRLRSETQDTNQETKLNITSDIWSAILNVSMLTTFVIVIISPEWHALVLTLIALVFSVGGFVIYKITKQNMPFFVYSGVAIALLAYVTFLLCGDNTKALAAAYTIEVAVLALVSYMFTKNLRLSSNLSLLFAGPVLLLMNSVTNILRNSVNNYNYNAYYNNYSNNLAQDTTSLLPDYAVVLLFIIISTLTAFYFKTEARKLNNSELEKEINAKQTLVLGVCSLLVLAIIWGLCQVAFGEAGYTVALIIYAIIGVVMYVYGKNTDRKSIKTSGMLLIGLTVLWLVTILIAADPVFRIIGFVVIGIVLLSSAFLLKNKN